MTTNNGQYNGWYVPPQTLSNQANALSDTLLVIGTTMRLTRLVVTDDLGQWWVKDPLDAWMHQHPPSSPWEDTKRSNPMEDMRQVAGGESKRMRWHQYLGGLECPFCVGFWVGAAVLASYHILPRGLWRFAARALTLNEAAAHLGIKIGDFG